METLEPRDALALIEKNVGNPDFLIIDVRTPAEFAEGHIKGATNIDYNSGNFRAGVEGLDRNRTYIVYCRTGRRTAKAVEIMQQLGFKKIYRIKGDIQGWKSASLPLVTSPVDAFKAGQK